MILCHYAQDIICRLVLSHRQRNTTFAIRNLYIQTKISCKINKTHTA